MEQEFSGNFLHNLPQAIVPKQRIALEAISFSLDTIEQTYLELVAGLSTYLDIKQLRSFQRSDRVSIFSKVWVIIDSSHAVLQLLQGFEKKTKQDSEKKVDFLIEGKGSKTNKVAKTFYADYGEKIRSLRNKMDHLGGNLNAIVSKKASQEPLFGTLSYILSDAENCASGEFDVIVLGSTPFTSDKHSFSALNPTDIRRKIIFHPVDHLQFSAFDGFKVSITDLFEDSINLRRVINTDMASMLSAALKRHARENSLEEKDVFQTMPGEFVGGMKVQMVSDKI